MTAIVLAFQQAGSWGWTSPGVLAPLAAGLALVPLFVALERRSQDPLVNLAGFADRGFTVSVVVTLLCSIVFVPVFFFLSVYGQVSLRLSALDTGLLFLKLFAGFVITSRIGSTRFDRHGAKPVVALGGTVGAVGFMLSPVSTDAVNRALGASYGEVTAISPRTTAEAPARQGGAAAGAAQVRLPEAAERISADAAGMWIFHPETGAFGRLPPGGAGRA
ncbi:hypothetical protein KCV87_09005 [Actinosynnema pretiosum subsp. pretiosum]|uniref:Uncharacterized protein n=1 Tax=Actinosynnema pretiosum subsp. pretiosum TaxID=103721 RepID=A0AA45LAK0_9PSEU|nr:hypothetical protein KCV87_09005 [Actinosynnema pretiosum subsp. pretiosum]